MQYTKYISFLVKENGQPNMSSEGFRTMMIIVYLEGVIIGLKKSKKACIGTDLQHRFDVALFREQKRVAEITGNLKPSEFIIKILS